MQDEAAKSEEIRHQEKLAWEFIREEQRKRGMARSPENYLVGSGHAKSSENCADSPCPHSQPVGNAQEAANILRAGLKVHVLCLLYMCSSKRCFHIVGHSASSQTQNNYSSYEPRACIHEIASSIILEHVLSKGVCDERQLPLR